MSKVYKWEEFLLLYFTKIFRVTIVTVYMLNGFLVHNLVRVYETSKTDASKNILFLNNLFIKINIKYAYYFKKFSAPRYSKSFSLLGIWNEKRWPWYPTDIPASKSSLLGLVSSAASSPSPASYPSASSSPAPPVPASSPPAPSS